MMTTSANTQTRVQQTAENKVQQDGKLVLPLPPQDPAMTEEMEIYARFFRHLRHVPHSRMDIKILSSIQFTADFLDHSDAHVAKILVDLGLRAPRMAFPADFLRFADDSLMRSGWEVGGPSAALMALNHYWDISGEDKFAGFKRDYSLLAEAAA